MRVQHPRTLFLDGYWTHLDIRDVLVQNGVTVKENAISVSVAIQNWIALLADSPQSKAIRKPLKVVRKFFNKLISQPWGETVGLYSRLAATLMGVASYDGQVINTGDFVPEFQKTPIFRDYLEWYRTGESSAFDYVLNFCLYTKKLPLVSQEAEAAAFRSWLDTEERLQSFSVPDNFDIVRRIIEEALIAPPSIPFAGIHGPGSTAEGVRLIYDKIAKFSLSRKLDRYINRKLGKTPQHVGFARDALFAINSNVKSDAATVSKLMFVIKYEHIARTICKEPIAYQFCQQSYRWELEKSIEGGFMSQIVNLSNQDYNQRAAQYGSLTGKVDTIDESAASDSVHIGLIRALFPREIAYNLLATRTSVVSYKGKKIHVKKFAPMGSALCFPTQCIIFSALTCYAYLLHYYTGDLDLIRQSLNVPGFLRRLYRAGYEKIRVYGDDIICDARVSPTLIKVLTEYGFIVNTDKSYFGEQAFRESCGEYYFAGDKVTPVFFRVKHYTSLTLEYAPLASLIALINQLGDKGYRNARSHLIQMVLFHFRLPGKNRNSGVNAVAFTSHSRDDCGAPALAIYSKDPRNNHLKSREPSPEQIETLARTRIECKDVDFPSYVRYNRAEMQAVTAIAAKKVPYPLEDEDENLYHAVEGYMLMKAHRRSYSGGFRHEDNYKRRLIRDINKDNPHDAAVVTDIRLAVRWTPRPG